MTFNLDDLVIFNPTSYDMPADIEAEGKICKIVNIFHAGNSDLAVYELEYENLLVYAEPDELETIYTL
jgi:hypothetical protein